MENDLSVFDPYWTEQIKVAQGRDVKVENVNVEIKAMRLEKNFGLSVFPVFRTFRTFGLRNKSGIITLVSKVENFAKPKPKLPK